MSLNQLVSGRRALPYIVGLAGLLSLGGCSWLKWGSGKDAAPQLGAATDTTDSTAIEPGETVTSNLPDEPDAAAADAATGAVSATETIIPDATATISPTAPKSHVVQRGDTLWGLAGLFLKDPWAWPEIWYLNPEVANPHRIYPGDTLRLATGAQGQPQLQLARGAAAAAGGAPEAIAATQTPVPAAGTRLRPMLRGEELSGPIANIPYALIAAFLSRPGVITKKQVNEAPYVLALRDGHLIAGTGNDIYVKKLHATEGERFSVLHVADRLKDPDSGDVLGYLAVFTAVAQVSRAGDPATATLSESERETLTGDVLMPETAGSVGDFLPHAPARPVSGRILAVVNGVLLAGQYQIVAISHGTRDGLEPGDVLRVNESQQVVRDRCARIQGNTTCKRIRDTRLPIESAGTLLVFRSYERLSYALVAKETIPLHVGDHVVSP